MIARLISKVYRSKPKPLLLMSIQMKQTGLEQEHTITENIIMTHDIRDCSEHYCLQDILLNQNFTKAYNRVQWPFSSRMLQNMGFGKNCIHFKIKWYCRHIAALSTNLFTTKLFHISKVVQQGDPVSSFLFVL